MLKLNVHLVPQKKIVKLYSGSNQDLSSVLSGKINQSHPPAVLIHNACFRCLTNKAIKKDGLVSSNAEKQTQFEKGTISPFQNKLPLANNVDENSKRTCKLSLRNMNGGSFNRGHE